MLIVEDQRENNQDKIREMAERRWEKNLLAEKIERLRWCSVRREGRQILLGDKVVGLNGGKIPQQKKREKKMNSLILMIEMNANSCRDREHQGARGKKKKNGVSF